LRFLCEPERSANACDISARDFAPLAAAAPTNAMQLFVRTLSGRTTTVEAAADERLSALKARLSPQALGAPGALVRLTSGGRELEDARTLGQLQLSAGATLHAALRLRGGAPTHIKLVSQRCREPFVVVRARARPRAPSASAAPRAAQHARERALSSSRSRRARAD
jgi:hypothetical protein